MEKRQDNELGASQYCVSEDGQRRLEKLRDHMEFLSRLARPRTELEWVPDICSAEVSVCLQLLAEQATRVLQHITWDAPVQEAPVDAGAVEPGVSKGETDEGSELIFGITLAQMDALGRLCGSISAVSDVVGNSDTAELADHTLPVLGQSMLDATDALRDMLDQIERQRLQQHARRRSATREQRARYVVVGAVRHQGRRGFRPAPVNGVAPNARRGQPFDF